MKTTTAELIQRGVLEIGDGYRAKNSELAASGVPFARAGNIDNGFDFGDADQFPADRLKELGGKVSRPGDTVFTSKGTVGRFAFVTEETPTFVLSPQLSYWRSLDHGSLDPEYLFYWIQGPEFGHQAAGVKSQTDMADYIRLADQRRMSITVPSVRDQQQVGRTLRLFDHKIDLNRRTNRTLEALAESLFRSWFVDFDPVVAKADGREPFGMDAETAALFPDAFVDSELGPIPEGWAVSMIGEEPEVVGGTTPRTKNPEYWGGGVIHWATPKDLSGLDIPILLDTSRKITEAGLDQISSGLLPVGTVLMSSRAPIGYTAIAGVPTAVNQGFVAMIPRNRLGSHYLLFWTRDAMHEIESRAGGTTFAEISKKNFRPIPVLVPAPQVLEVFESRAGEWFDLIRMNAEQNQTVTALRDLLLPKLLSGEIRVEEAEELVESA